MSSSTERRYDISNDAAAAWHIPLQIQRRLRSQQDSGLV
jgi:hypothetical protein